jgi:hypothetical protein
MPKWSNFFDDVIVVANTTRPMSLVTVAMSPPVSTTAAPVHDRESFIIGEQREFVAGGAVRYADVATPCERRLN